MIKFPRFVFCKWQAKWCKSHSREPTESAVFGQYVVKWRDVKWRNSHNVRAIPYWAIIIGNCSDTFLAEIASCLDSPRSLQGLNFIRVQTGPHLRPCPWPWQLLTSLLTSIVALFYRPCQDFNPSRLMLSHFGLLTIEGLKVNVHLGHRENATT